MTDLSGKRLFLRDNSDKVRVKVDAEKAGIYGYDEEGRSIVSLPQSVTIVTSPCAHLA